MLDPGDLLALLERAVEDAQQGEAAEERRRVEVGDVGLQRVLVVVGGRRDVVEDRLEQRLEVVVVRQGAVLRLVGARGAVAAGRVDDGHVEDRVEVEVRVLVRHVGREAEEQVLALGHDLVDARVGAVGLVDQEDHGQLRLERLAEHEARLGQRALGRVDEEHDAVDHGQAALDLAAEVGVARGVDHVDDDGRAVRVLPVVEHRGVLREDRDALLALEVVRVHHAVLALEVGVERVRLLEHGVDERGLAVVDVGHDGHIAEVVARD